MAGNSRQEWIGSALSALNPQEDAKLAPLTVVRATQQTRDSKSPPVVAPISEHDPYPVYEPGLYEAQCTHASIYYDKQFRAWKALLRFQLVPYGGEVCGFLNLGPGAKTKAGRRSRYWRAWVIANGEQPRKRQALSERVFKGKIFEVQIDYVQRSSDGREHPAAAMYSTVKEILSRKHP